MRASRTAQLQNSPGVRHFHLWSGMASGLPALAGPEVRVYAGKLLRRLSKAYAVRLEGFAFTADQLHLVVEWQPEAAQGWSEDELARRWRIAQPLAAAHPTDTRARIEGEVVEAGAFGPSGMPGGMPGGMPMPGGVQPMPGAPAAGRPVSPHARRLLGSVSAFLQRFKQLLTYHINRLAGRKGTIWRGRFGLAPLADASAVAGAMAFVDLLPVAKGDGQRPEESPASSLHARVILYKMKFGMPPYGPAGDPNNPDGQWQPLPAEVTAELRDDRMAHDYENMEPPPQGGSDWVVGLRGDGAAGQNGVGLGFTLRKYLGLLDQLAAKAKGWPHIPVGAPGRASPPPLPAWESAITQAVETLGLLPQAFAAQWTRLARLRA